MNILHLSDIHFGRDRCGIKESFTKKTDILNNLIDTLIALDDNMKPDLVLVTGDIAWRGKASKFDEAYTWFTRLKTAQKVILPPVDVRNSISTPAIQVFRFTK